jgi:hypothetical protein
LSCHDLAVRIETLIEQALAQVGIPIVALTAFIALAAILPLRLLTGKTRSPWGFVHRRGYVGLTEECSGGMLGAVLGS